MSKKTNNNYNKTPHFLTRLDADQQWSFLDRTGVLSATPAPSCWHPEKKALSITGWCLASTACPLVPTSPLAAVGIQVRGLIPTS